MPMQALYFWQEKIWIPALPWTIQSAKNSNKTLPGSKHHHPFGDSIYPQLDNQKTESKL
jgi:hypothetical protein